MTERSQDCRSPSAGRRHIEVRDHVEPRPALESDVLDAIALALDDSRDSRIQRCPLERAAQHRPELLHELLLAVAQLLSIGYRAYCLSPPFPRLVGEPYQISLEVV